MSFCLSASSNRVSDIRYFHKYFISNMVRHFFFCLHTVDVTLELPWLISVLRGALWDDVALNVNDKAVTQQNLGNIVARF